MALESFRQSRIQNYTLRRSGQAPMTENTIIALDILLIYNRICYKRIN